MRQYLQEILELMVDKIKKIRIAYFDNTLPKKKYSKDLFAGGETDDRLSGLKKAQFKDVKVDPIIVDPYPFPLNPLRKFHSLYSGIDPLRSIKTLLKIKKFDAIFCVNESSALFPLFLKSFLPIRKPVIVLDPALSLGWRPRKLILDFVIPRADKIVVFGRNQEEYIQENWGSKCKSQFIFHGIDTKFYSPDFRKEEDYIFSIGNDHGRDFKLLVDALNGLDVKLKIKTNLDVPVGAKNNNSVDLVKERIPFTELKRLYAGCKFVVIPLHDCQHASGVNSVLEAMAMGKALIVSRSKGILDYVVDKENAILVEPGNRQQLSDKIKFLLSNPDEARRLGNNARDFVLRNCDTEVYNKNLIKIIADTCQ